MVGDVAGHGVEAATAMTQVRTALRAYLFDGDTPARCLDRLDLLMDGLLDQRVATAFVAVVEPATGRIAMANAGHPCRPCSSTAAGRATSSSPPGRCWGSARARRRRRRGPAGRPTLLLYTDGLVERRGVDLVESLDQLREAAGAGPVGGGHAELSAWADALLGAVPGLKDDDTTVVALRLSGP